MLDKVTYTDQETVISAKNMNEIQDAILALDDGLFSVDNDKSGEVITITDAAKRGFRSFNIYGKTTQDGTPTPDAPVDLVTAGGKGNISVNVTGKNILPYPYKESAKTVNGVTFTVNGDGSVAVSGTATGTANFMFTDYSFRLKKGITYTLSLGNDFQATGNPYVWIAISSTDAIAGINMSIANSVTFTPQKDVYNAAVYIITQTVGSTFSGTIHPQIEVGANATDYEPYKAQTMTFETPNGLPGILVTSGGNYTDANGQQWICDEKDYARGVYVQRVGSKVFDGSSDEVWGIYTSAPEYAGYFRFEQDMAVGTRQGGFCDSFQIHSTYGAGQIGIWLGVSNNAMYVHNALGLAADFESWSAWLSKNPITIQFILATPIETPLSEEELAAYRSLHTYKDNTTVSNDAGAWMELEYAMDAKKYIDSKISGAILAATVE